MKRLAIAVISLAVPLFAASYSVAVAADFEAGKAVVAQQCAVCHGLDGKGVAPGIPNLAGQPERYLLDALNEYRHGQRIHAALRSMAEQLSPADEQNVAAYFAGLPSTPPEAGAGPRVFSPYDHGREVSQPCAKCHGEDGNSVIPGTPSLAGQQPRYLINAIREYLVGAREASPMHPLITKLKDIDVESLALYFASQTPAHRPAPPSGKPAAGQALITLCSGCHGTHGVSGDASTPNLAGQDPIYLVNALKAYRAGRSHAEMQRVVGVAVKSDEDVDDVAAFYTVQPGVAAEHGQTLIHDIAEKCDRCHSPGTANPTLVTPNIRGQDKNYLVMALRSYRDGRRTSSMMHNMTLPYDDAVIEGVASYYAAQPPH